MSQSKAMSLVEAITNTLVGLALAFAVNAALMHWTGVTATAMQNFLIVAGHTVVSVLRSYLIRRVFNSEFWVNWRLKLRRRWLEFKYRHQDDSVCCCGSNMGEGGSICHHGGCRSMKEYVIDRELER